MSKQKIVLIEEEDENGGQYSYLDYSKHWNSAKDLDHQPTIETLSDFLDGKAESRNNHAFVGKHRILSAILIRQLGRESATRIMFEIAEYGGLDGASFSDFDIPECWNDWSLDHLDLASTI